MTLSRSDLIAGAVALSTSADRALGQAQAERDCGNLEAADFCMSVYKLNRELSEKFWKVIDAA